MQLMGNGEEGATRSSDGAQYRSCRVRKMAFVGLAAILARCRTATVDKCWRRCGARRVIDGGRSPRQSSSGNAKQPPDEHTSVGDICDPLRALFRAEYWAGV
jgi:hypothetical protein